MSASTATQKTKQATQAVEETSTQAKDTCESTFNTAKKHVVEKATEAKDACDQYAAHVKKTVSDASEKITKPIEEKKEAVIKFTNDKKAVVQGKVQEVRTQVTEKTAAAQEKAQEVRNQVAEKTTAAQEKVLGAVECLKGEPSEAGKIEKAIVSVATFAAKTSIHIASIGLDALGMKDYTQKRLHVTNSAIWKFVDEHPRISSTGNALAAYWPIKIGHRAVSQVSANLYA